MQQQPLTWWQTGVIYQIYPRSFMDANGDGVGDLAGIEKQLDYLQWLGVHALWLSPIYPSPMADFGYDVADYCDIDPLFGSLSEFDQLLDAVHQRGMKLILDLVPNHSSDEHPWFQTARTSRDNAKRDWYIWRDPDPDGGPPNNWLSHFGGPAWTLDPATGQYYLHLFDPKQPDLNWRNPAVREAIYSVMRFWFERGVDGFRIDVLWVLIKDQELRDNPINPDWQPSDPPAARLTRVYDQDQPEVHDIVREMRVVADSYEQRLLIGEIYLPPPQLVRYYGDSELLDGVQLPFNFQLPLLPHWNASSVRQVVDAYETILPAGAWPNWVLGNHDQPRIASRVGPDQTRIAQMLLLTLRGTPTCYYGDEIGMEDVMVTANAVVDPQGLHSPGHGRDPERSPMQWSAAANAGFSEVTPWLPVAPDYLTRNVAAQRDNPTSPLSLFRRLLQLRSEFSTLVEGNYQSLAVNNDAVFCYLRCDDSQRLLIALNFGGDHQQLHLKLPETGGMRLCSTYMDGGGVGSIDLANLSLRPHEGLLIQLDS